MSKQWMPSFFVKKMQIVDWKESKVQMSECSKAKTFKQSSHFNFAQCKSVNFKIEIETANQKTESLINP